MEGCLDAVDNLRDPDPTKRFSASTPLANAVRIEVTSELPCFTYKGITLSTEGDRPWFHFDRSKYPDLTYRIRIRSKRIGDSIEDFYVGPSIPPIIDIGYRGNHIIKMVRKLSQILLSGTLPK
jgi:hypothetical protein